MAAVLPPPQIHRFTRLPALGDKLAELVAQRDKSMIFREEIILVDGKAMSNWLSRHLILEASVNNGTGLGIQMRAELLNFQRLAPRFAAIIEGTPASKRVQDSMADLKVRVHRLLCQSRGPHAKSFAAEIGEPEKDGGQVRWELSGRLADWLFELSIDDPDWIIAAQTKGTGGRLEALWRDVRAELGPEDALITAADVAQRLIKDTKARQLVADQLPGRITLVATGNVPRSLLLSLNALRSEVKVNVLCLQPSLDYHLDLEWDTKAMGTGTPGETLLRQTAKHYRAQLGKFLDLEGW